MGTNVEASHAFGRCARCAVGAACTKVVAPTNVAFALQLQVVSFQLFRTVFSALVIFLFLLGGPFAAFGQGGSVFFGGGAVGCGFELAVGSGNTSIVTRGSVVSFLKSPLSTGWSLTGRNDLVCCCARIVQSSLSALKI